MTLIVTPVAVMCVSNSPYTVKPNVNTDLSTESCVEILPDSVTALPDSSGFQDVVVHRSSPMINKSSLDIEADDLPDAEETSESTRQSSSDSSLKLTNTGVMVDLTTQPSVDISLEEVAVKSPVLTLPEMNVVTCNEFTFGSHEAHKFIALDIPQHILKAMYALVSILPLMQYEVICGALKQICFY